MSTTVFRPRFRSIFFRRLLWLAGVSACLLHHGRAGTATATADVGPVPSDDRLPPALVITIAAEEPESLPSVSIALERLLYDLNRNRHRFSGVSVNLPDAPGGGRLLQLAINVHQLGLEQANLHSFWPPITQREEDGTRVLFSGQLPMKVALVLSDGRTGKRLATTSFTAQSTGRTITAGTTDVVGVLIARRTEHFLQTQRGLYVAR